MREHRREIRDYLTRAIKSEIESLIEQSNILPDEREIIILRFSKGWSIVKISQHMNLSEKTVGRRIERAYDKLYKALPF